MTKDVCCFSSFLSLFSFLLMKLGRRKTAKGKEEKGEHRQHLFLVYSVPSFSFAISSFQVRKTTLLISFLFLSTLFSTLSFLSSLFHRGREEGREMVKTEKTPFSQSSCDKKFNRVITRCRKIRTLLRVRLLRSLV